jgi:hypothetical protein
VGKQLICYLHRPFIVPLLQSQFPISKRDRYEMTGPDLLSGRVLCCAHRDFGISHVAFQEVQSSYNAQTVRAERRDMRLANRKGESGRFHPQLHGPQMAI